MSKKIIFLLVLTALVAAGLFAGGGSQAAPAPAVPAPTGAPGVVNYPVTGNPKITISRVTDSDIPTAGFSSYNDTPGVKELIKQTGINVEFIELVDQNAYLLYLAGGNLPDIIMAGKTFYPGGTSKMVEDGLAQDLTNYLPTYAPDYWKFINSDPQYYKVIREPDGKHYAFAGYFLQPGNIYGSWIGLVARKEFLDKLGMAAPETASDLYTYLKRSKDELGCDVPFMSAAYRLAMAYTGGALTSAFGLPKTDTYQIDGKVHYGAYEPAYRDVMTYMNKLYTDGLLDKNFAVTDEPTAHASVLNGQTSLIFTATSRIQNMTMAAPDQSKFTLLGLKALSTAKGVRPMYNYADDLVTFSYWCFFPQKSRDVVNGLKLLNYLHTEKGNLLANFGEDGVTYTMQNGNPVFNDFTLNNPKGLPIDGVLRSYGLLNFPITQDPRMSRQRFPLQQQIQAMEVWADADTAKYKIPNNSIIADNASEYASLSTDINTYINESQAQFISGALPLSRFDDYIATLKKMGMDRMLQILQASYDVYNK
ncbi:MAG: extracellular solute-binding protein [Treponema sp.]|nr:extracellular solute-binding protein [Treponema sp.]